MQIYIGAPPAKKQWRPQDGTELAHLMARTGIVMNHSTQRWYKALNVQGMTYRGDKCCPRSTISCMVLLRESATMRRNWHRHRDNHTFCNPLAIVAGFVQLQGEKQPFALVRVVAPEFVIPHARLRCRMVVGWNSYLGLAKDTRHRAQLVPVSDIQAQTVVVNCCGSRLLPREPTAKLARAAWRHSVKGALGVVPYM